MDDLVAAVRAAANGTAEDKARLLLEIDLESVRSLSHSNFAPDAHAEVLAVGIGASPGAASGEIVLSAEQAIAAVDAGRTVVLVRSETTPDDVVGMQVSAGILTSRGGVASHAAVVARGWGIPAVVGASGVVVDGDSVRIGDRCFSAGDTISIDGSSGHVYAGALTVTFEAPPEEIELLHAWSRRVTAGRVSIRANADTANDALHARTLGAEGVGLCRTEHMFLAADRLPLIRTFILSEEGSTQAHAALAALEEAQVADFVHLFRAMNGLPVTVRLLDPPLHEFLPPIEPLIVAEGRGELDSEGRRLIAAIRRLHESNPMIGTRGVRLAMVRQGLYQMQVRSIARAAGECVHEGFAATVEIMIPLVTDDRELALARSWVEQTWLEVAPADVPTPSIGAMIETPRAALIADRLSAYADFFSFGTNDLTQLTFGLSRDDVEVGLIPAYLEADVFDANPFAVLDPVGVGELIGWACSRARAHEPAIRISACGEHAGDPESIAVLMSKGVESLSCSPPRIPLARLAAAQILLRAGAVGADVLADAATMDAPSSVARDAIADVNGNWLPTSTDILHILRIKGFADAPGIADSLLNDPAAIAPILADLVTQGLVRLFEARGIYQLTPLGVEHHDRLTDELLPPGFREGVHAMYEQFLGLNSSFKELCTRWQIRDGRPNEHEDRDYDAACVEDLATLLASANTVFESLAAPMARFDMYSRRLQRAMHRLAEGDRAMFTGVACGSVHDVWMEIHEDLIRVLGIDRVTEGSF